MPDSLLYGNIVKVVGLRFISGQGLMVLFYAMSFSEGRLSYSNFVSIYELLALDQVVVCRANR